MAAMRHTFQHDRVRKLENDRYDVIVVGTGIGGLTAAALLAKRGKSVLVLDMHYALGGCATVFRRRGYEFDVGVHYIGDCGEDGLVPRILRGAGVEDLQFLEMDPDGFDTLVFPDFRFTIPRGLEAFRSRLLEAFPSEARGIDRYTKLLRQVWSLMSIPADPSSALRILPRSLLALRYLNATVAEFLDTCTRDVRLRAVLTGQLGVYHQPPSRASLAGHAGVSMHFLQGSFYPQGGGQALSDGLAAAIESHGGKILLRTTARSFLIEDGRVRGVEIENPHLGRRVLRAPVVISNADIKRTLLKLVGAENLPAAAVRKTRQYEMAPAMGVVYLGVARDLSAEGVRNSNFRIYPGYDHEPTYKAVGLGAFPENPPVFIGIASLKDPLNPDVAPPGITNMQLMSIVPSFPESWGTTAAEVESGEYRKNPRYLTVKERYEQTLLSAAETIFPGIGRQIAYREVSTPLTVSRYTGASMGTSYGLAMIPAQFLLRRPGPRTDIEGLYLCGASLRTGHGIFGAMSSGVEAAAQVVGRKLVREVMGPANHARRKTVQSTGVRTRVTAN
jgi:phytoene dehydrogenase-like protein